MNKNPRNLLEDSIESSRYDFQSLSLAIGRNKTYVQQYLRKGLPKNLPLDLAIDIGQKLGVDWRDLVPAQKRIQTLVESAPKNTVAIEELDVRAAAGQGAIVESNEVLRRWHTPPISGDTPPELTKIITVTGDSMEPTLYNGDYVLADTSKTTPTPPGMFVIFDGMGLLIKRIEFIPQSKTVRISSDNDSYATYELPLEEVLIQGRVTWISRTV